MRMNFSTKEEFVQFMYDRKKEHISTQLLSNDFKDLYDDALPFPETTLTDIAKFANRMIIINEWDALINADKSFFDKNGFIQIEYDETTATASLVKRHRGRPASINSASKNISVRLTDEKIVLIDDYCKNHSIDNRSQFINIAIDALLNTDNQDK